MSLEDDGDVNNARKFAMAFAARSGAPWWVPAPITWLTFVVILGGGCLLMIPGAAALHYAIVACMTSVLQYYYGTTKAASEQRAVIANALSTAQTPKPPEGG